ncbi:MAG: lipase [Firmicutes bacterium]|nr:lipase [Bacillota bacterium]
MGGMKLKKMLATMTLLSSLFIVGLTGSVFAAPNNAESKSLDVQIKHPVIQLISDVVYEQVPMRGYDNVAMQMDVLKPKKAEKMPAIVFITGGGFINANKDSYIQQRMALAEAGYVVASIEYRVAPTAKFPQPLEDVKAAIRYLKANADKFNINANKIGVLGESAGGYLSAMAGTTNGTKLFDKGENLNQNSNIQAVVDIYGLSDLTRVGADFSKEVQEAHKSAGATEALWVNGSSVFGGKDGGILANPEEAKAANPLTYISKKTPPFLLMHGDKDTLVSPSQTEILHQALVAHGIESTRYVVRGAQHGGVYWVQPEVMQVVIDFFDKHLK